jgi:TPR repeat protein
MPDESSAADQHAILQEIVAPRASLTDDPLPLAADVQFPRVLRGYDPLAVDAYVKKTSQLVGELQSTHSPEAAVRRAFARMGEQIAGILQRAYETAEQTTAQSRREVEERLEQAHREAVQIAAAGEQRIKDLDADTHRIWAERLRIVEDVRELATQLLALAALAAATPAVSTFIPAEREGPDDALAAYRRADERGDAVGTFNLGGLLLERGDQAAALSAYRRADKRGHPAAASNVGVLLEQAGDADGAVAAYRRADERGDATGAFNLAGLMLDRGDLPGAVAAYRRAESRGDLAAASNLGVVLQQHGDVDGAVAAYRRADERGDATSAFNLGALLANRGDLAGAAATYERASARDDPEVAQIARVALEELRHRRTPVQAVPPPDRTELLSKPSAP